MLSERRRDPRGNPKFNFNYGYTTARRNLTIRKVDQSRLEKYIIPLRIGRVHPSKRREYGQAAADKFDQELLDEKKLHPTMTLTDYRYEMPSRTDRVNMGRRRKLPRRVRIDLGPTMQEVHGFDGDLVRERLAKIGPAAFDTIRQATFYRTKRTQRRHMIVDVADTDMDAPMPTHFLRISTETSLEEDNLLTPIHAAFMRAHWTRLGGLPEFTPMDICTPVEESTGKPMPQYEFAHGELPMIDLRVHNLQTVPHIISYIYQRDPAWLLQQLIGEDSKEFGQKFAHAEQSWDMREAEWVVAQKIGAQFDRNTLEVHAWFVQDMVENANAFGMEDQGFWWALDSALRIIMDALVLQERFH